LRILFSIIIFVSTHNNSKLSIELQIVNQNSAIPYHLCNRNKFCLKDWIFLQFRFVFWPHVKLGVTTEERKFSHVIRYSIMNYIQSYINCVCIQDIRRTLWMCVMRDSWIQFFELVLWGEMESLVQLVVSLQFWWINVEVWTRLCLCIQRN